MAPINRSLTFNIEKIWRMFSGLMECLHQEVNADRPNNRIKTSIVCPYFVNTSALYTKAWNIRSVLADRIIFV